MTAEFYQRTKELFQAALGVASERREEFLARACGEDVALRTEVEALLASDSAAEGFLEPPARAGNLGAGDDVEVPALPEGTCIGSYVIVSRIGHGGMGAVYLARRADPELPGLVALKVVRRGMDSGFILRRFRAERRILAGLEHPNIARFLDGGAAADGLPFFVMEYVQGEHILDYCDRRRLATRARLELFRTVCAAVQYAHTHLVVHRDIKPSNILVTPAGVPYLLDFGIAKLLHAESSDEVSQPGTASALGILTPEYASPEQVRGERITTASDVYSLGVLLYELLTGRRPYGPISHAPHEIARAVCEVEPERPSVAVGRIDETPPPGGMRTAHSPDAVSEARDGSLRRLRRALAGDLDTITLVALRKEPGRRYASVEQLAEDIKRHLTGLPLLAQRDAISYRAGKFFRRHKVGVGAVTVIAASLVTGVIATVWEARIARAERARAERRFAEVRALAHSFLFEFYDAIQSLGGSTPARELLVKRGLQYLDGLASEAGNDLALKRELADAYERVGDVQGRVGQPNLGNTAGALASYRKALAIRRTIFATNPAGIAERDALARGLLRMAEAYEQVGDVASSLTHAREGTAIRESLAAAAPADVEAAESLAEALHTQGNVLENSGDRAGGLAVFRRECELFQALSAQNPGSVALRRGVVIGLFKVAQTLADLGDRRAAIDSYLKALVINEQLIAADPANATFLRDRTFLYGNIGYNQSVLGDFTRAIANLRRSLVIREDLVRRDARDANIRMHLAVGYSDLGQTLAAAGLRSDGVESLRRGVAILTSLERSDPANVQIPTELADVYSNLGAVYEPKESAVHLTPRQREAMWRDARHWYQLSLGVWNAMRARGVLAGGNLSHAADSQRAVERCDAALSTAGRVVHTAEAQPPPG